MARNTSSQIMLIGSVVVLAVALIGMVNCAADDSQEKKSSPDADKRTFGRVNPFAPMSRMRGYFSRDLQPEKDKKSVLFDPFTMRRLYREEFDGKRFAPQYKSGSGSYGGYGSRFGKRFSSGNEKREQASEALMNMYRYGK